MRRSWLKRLLPLFALAPAPASAQLVALPPRTDVAGSRAQPEYDAIGIRLGSWMLAPTLRLTSGYDGNVFGQSDRASSDGFVIASPALRAGSNWGRHAVTLAAHGDFTRYLHFAGQNTDEYAVQGSARIDLSRATVTMGASIDRAAERRGTNGVPLTFGEPSLYRTIAQSITAQQEFSRFRFSMTGRHADISYSAIRLPDGSADDQRFRDTGAWDGETRITYSGSSASALFAAARYGEEHAGEAGSCCARRNRNRSMLGGIALDGGLIRGEISAGYLHRSFSNPAFRDFGGPVYAAALSWYPTTLLTIDVNASQTLGNSGIARVGALITRTTRIDLTYELLRNLVIKLAASARKDRYREIDTQTDNRMADFRSRYQFNRTVALAAYGRYECRDSSRTNTVGNYCAVMTGISLDLQR